MVRDKVRIRFHKTGDLRLISHHDLMRCFERMLRRADLPFHSTAGFNPKPRLVFAMPLPLGIIGSAEIVELELDQEIAPEEIHARLSGQAPPGIVIENVERISPRATAHVCRVTYRLPLSGGLDPELPCRIQSLLSSAQCFVDRARPQPRRIDVRPYIADLRLLSDALELDFVVTPNGSARPDEIIEILGLRPLLENGAVLERTRLELAEETCVPGPLTATTSESSAALAEACESSKGNA